MKNKKSSDYLKTYITTYHSKLKSNKLNGKLFQLKAITKIPRHIQNCFTLCQSKLSIKVLMTQLRYHWCKISKISQVFVHLQTALYKLISDNKMLQRQESKLLLTVEEKILKEIFGSRETAPNTHCNRKPQPLFQRLLKHNKSIDFSLVDSSCYSRCWNRFININIFRDSSY